jgi:hypothetical protein
MRRSSPGKPPPEKISVLGVDPGTRTAGLVAMDGGGRVLFRNRLVLNGDDPNRRLAALYRAVDRALARSKAAILAIENPSHPRNARTAHLLGRAVGVCTLAASLRELIVLEFRPSQLKAAERDLSRRFRKCSTWSPDEVSAACAAMLALRELHHVV